MSTKKRIRHSKQKGLKQRKVLDQAVLILAREGPLNQSQLISRVAKALPRIDMGSVSTFTRRGIQKGNGILFSVKRSKSPLRVMCDVTVIGLTTVAGVLNLYEYAKALTRADPKTATSYRILAQSQGLARTVERMMKKKRTILNEIRDSVNPSDKRAGAQSGLFVQMLFPLSLKYAIGAEIMLLLLEVLVSRKDLTKEVNPTLLAEFSDLSELLIKTLGSTTTDASKHLEQFRNRLPARKS